MVAWGADAVAHSELIKSVARRVVDQNVLRLIKMWLRAPIEERDADGTRCMSGGKRNTRGTPQGGVASPLLANYPNDNPAFPAQRLTDI